MSETQLRTLITTTEHANLPVHNCTSTLWGKTAKSHKHLICCILTLPNKSRQISLGSAVVYELCRAEVNHCIVPGNKAGHRVVNKWQTRSLHKHLISKSGTYVTTKRITLIQLFPLNSEPTPPTLNVASKICAACVGAEMNRTVTCA